MSCRAIDFQADRIEAVLAKHKVPGRVSGGLVSPRWIKFNVIPSLDVRLSQAKGLDEALAATLGSDSCRISRQGNRLSVEVPRTDPQPIRLLPLQKHIGDVPFGTAILGLAEDDAPLLARLPAPEVGRVLVAGGERAGKTTLARSLVLSLALSHRCSQLGFVLVGEAFEDLARLPHLLRPVLTGAVETVRELSGLVETMAARRDGGEREPRVVVVIDETGDLPSPAWLAFNQLARWGSEAGIHVVACARTPLDARMVGAASKFPVRLVGWVDTEGDGFQAVGLRTSGAGELAGEGDFLAVRGGQVIRFQAAWVPPEQVEAALDRVVRQSISVTHNHSSKEKKK